MKFVELKAQNFLAFEEISYNFVDKPVLIQGDNRDDDGQESNGACKSGLFNVMEFCLFGEVSRDQNISDLIRFGQSEMICSVSIFCPIRNQTLLVERKVGKRGGAAQLSINGIVKWNFEDKMTSEINSFVLEWMDITKKDFQSFYLINGENVKPLFKLSNTDLVALISRFSNANLIEGLDKIVQQDIDVIDSKIREQESLKNQIIGKIKGFEEQITDQSSTDFEKQKSLKIQAKKDEIEAKELKLEQLDKNTNDLKQKNKEYTALIAGTSKSLTELNSVLEKQKTSTDFSKKYNKLDEEISEVRKKVEEQTDRNKKAKKQLNEAEDILSDIEKNLKGSVVCPKCSHEFSISDPELDIEQERKALPKVESVIKKASETIKEIREKIKEFDNEISEFEGKKSEIRKEEREHEERLRKIKRQITDIEEEIEGYNSTIIKNENKIKNSLIEKESLKEGIKLLEQQLETIKQSKKDDSLITDLKQKIQENESLFEKHDKEIEKLNIELFEVKQWIFNFKKFNGHLANKSLKIIQGYTNKHLMDMNSDIQVRIEGFKENSKGELVEKITPYLIREGEERKLGSFSKGERGRINIATTMAVKGIMDKSNKWGGISQLFMDEAAEGLDGAGLSLIFKSVEKIGLPLMMTTHVTDKNVSSNILTVRKENGVSKLIY